MATPAAAPQRKPAKSAASCRWSAIPDSFFDELPSRLSAAAYVVVGQVLRRTRWSDAVQRPCKEWAAFNKEELARQLGVTVRTVFKAFEEAEAAGVLRSRKKGTRCEYSADVEAFSAVQERPPRKLRLVKTEPESEPQKVEAKVSTTCPVCEAPIVAQGELTESADGVFTGKLAAVSVTAASTNGRVDNKGLARGTRKISSGFGSPDAASSPPYGPINGSVANIGVTRGTRKISSGSDQVNAPEASAIWEQAKIALRSSLPQEAYANWFEQTEGLYVDGAGALRVAVPNSATASWLTEEYGDKIAALLPAGVTACYVVRRTETAHSPPAEPADSKTAMVEWLEEQLQLRARIGVLSAEDAEKLWAIRQRNRTVFEDAIAAKVRNYPTLRSWGLLVKCAQEAADRHTQRRLE
jgi:hypothetical protein